MNSQILYEIINKPKPLSEKQKNAVVTDKRYVRVIAGAGTGKTETLTRRIIYLLLCHEVEPRKIVAFTFTERAAKNMKSRIYERVKELWEGEKCAKLGEMYVGTIHGYCLQILHDYFGYGDYDVMDENQEMAFVLSRGWNLGLGLGGKYAEDCRNFIKSVNVVYNELISTGKLKKKNSDFSQKLTKYESLLDEHRLFTFGRMVALAVQKIKENPEKLSYISHLIVDEYQDINVAQEELVKVIGMDASVFIVGDPRQSIYQWRGSDEKCFERFPKLFHDVQTVMLEENRRSTVPIVKAANAFADTFEHRKYEHIVALRKEKGIAVKVEFETPEEEARWIISQIEKYVKGGRCRYNDCAILLRSVTTSAEPFIEELKRQDIPYIVGGKVGLFRRDEARGLGQIFSWLWDGGFWVEDPWEWNKRTKGEELLNSGIELWTGATQIKISKWEKSKFINWRGKVLRGEYKNFIEVFHELLLILGYKNLNPENKHDAAIMANLGRFSTLLSDYEFSIRLGGNGLNWIDAVKGLCWYMNAYASGAYEEHPSEDIRGIEAVQIMTVHQAKGLEWPVVFVPCMVKKRFPSSKIGTRQNWYVPRNLFDVKRYEGNIEDERRLFYVAITRARDIICITYFKKVNNPRERSPFIDDVEAVIADILPHRNLPLINVKPPSQENEIQTFSAGEILVYIKCPHFYRLREIWNYKPGLVEALGYGKSLHHCLRYASDLIKEGRTPEDAVLKAVNDKFHLPYAGSKAKRNMKKRARKVLLEYAKIHNEDMDKILEMEARLEFPVQKAIITGKVDVILKDENTMEVRDYKTSEEVTSYEQAALQVQLYALGLKMIGKPVKKASIAYLEKERRKEQIRKINIEEGTLQNARIRAEECIKNILNGKFQAKPENGYCDHCDHSKICKWNCNAK